MPLTPNSGKIAGSERLKSRRDRLQALKARRAGGGAVKAPTTDATPTQASITGDGIAGVMARLGDQGSEQLKARRKVLLKLYKRMTMQPRGGSPLIPDTPFSEAGVAGVMRKLRERAADETAPGGKVSAGLITFLSASDPEEPAIAGVSIERLQQLSRLVTRYKTKGEGNTPDS